MAVRTSEAAWHGNLREGHGAMRIGRQGYEGPYSFSSRFEEGEGTNPEELIAAAHAGCFSMALAGILTEAGHVPTKITTSARVTISPVEGGFGITAIALETVGTVPDIDQATFAHFAEVAKDNCPVSKALAAVPAITVKATLAG